MNKTFLVGTAVLFAVFLVSACGQSQESTTDSRTHSRTAETSALHSAVETDPLGSWNDTAPKKEIVDFVKRVTTAGSPDFVPVAERIATFDNDGTLWAEQPLYTQVRPRHGRLCFRQSRSDAPRMVVSQR